MDFEEPAWEGSTGGDLLVEELPIKKMKGKKVKNS